MECSQPAAWTTNRRLLVASSAKAFHGRPTNPDSTLPAAAYVEGGVIEYHQCLNLAIGKCSDIFQHANNPSWLNPAWLPSTTSIPATTQPTIAITTYAHVPTVTNSSAFHAQLKRFWHHPHASVVTQQQQSVKYHGVQPTGCMDNEPESSRGVPC